MIRRKGFTMGYRDKNMDAAGLIYKSWKMMEDTWVIQVKNARCYLLVGEEKAMLFDTGYGEGNIREWVEPITPKPLYVVNSHGHGDHSGGNGWWEEVYAAEEAVCSMRQPFGNYDEMKAKMTYPDYKVNIVKDGDIFELGGRQAEVIAIPAHSEGSIALLDKKARLLFSGDEVEAGQVLQFVRDTPIPAKEFCRLHKNHMEHLKSRQQEFDLICPSHNGTPISKEYLDAFIELDRRIIAGTADIMPDTGGNGFPPSLPKDGPYSFPNAGELIRSEYHGACYVYSREG